MAVSVGKFPDQFQRPVRASVIDKNDFMLRRAGQQLSFRRGIEIPQRGFFVINRYYYRKHFLHGSLSLISFRILPLRIPGIDIFRPVMHRSAFLLIRKLHIIPIQHL